ncbi:MAG: hypothetical protein WBM77_04860 [Maribacter sp.]
MAFNARPINPKHFIKSNMEAFFKEEEINTIHLVSETFGDEMFIGSVFCSDLPGNQKIMANKQQEQNIKILNERFGMVIDNEF